MEDILTVAPFQNTIDIVELKGRHVKEMFEYSVQNYDITGQNLFGGFLQVSGKIPFSIICFGMKENGVWFRVNSSVLA